jgi:hypothetical protein
VAGNEPEAADAEQNGAGVLSQAKNDVRQSADLEPEGQLINFKTLHWW